MSDKVAPGPENAVEYLERTQGKLTLGKLLRSIREGEEELQTSFATKLGVAQTFLSEVENDQSAVGAGRAAEWARKLGYLEAQFVQLSLQALLDAEGLKFKVEVHALVEGKNE